MEQIWDPPNLLTLFSKHGPIVCSLLSCKPVRGRKVRHHVVWSIGHTVPTKFKNYCT